MTKSYYHLDTIPSDLMDIVERDLSEQFGSDMVQSGLMGAQTPNLDIRNSQNAWVPTTHWVGGLIWHYFTRANNEFFNYKLVGIDGESMQYTSYGLNQQYNWHIDEGIGSMYRPAASASNNRKDPVRIQDFLNEQGEQMRKLSVIVQLAHGDDYEGGSTEIKDLDGKVYTVPRERGTIVFFDSRLHHRACTVTKGLRKSLIAWAIGPRWR